MFVRLLSRCSCSSETRSELRDSGEGSRSFLAAGRQAVTIRILPVHRERQGGHQRRGNINDHDVFSFFVSAHLNLLLVVFIIKLTNGQTLMI